MNSSGENTRPCVMLGSTQGDETSPRARSVPQTKLAIVRHIHPVTPAWCNRTSVASTHEVSNAFQMSTKAQKICWSCRSRNVSTKPYMQTSAPIENRPDTHQDHCGYEVRSCHVPSSKFLNTQETNEMGLYWSRSDASPYLKTGKTWLSFQEERTTFHSSTRLKKRWD